MSLCSFLKDQSYRKSKELLSLDNSIFYPKKSEKFNGFFSHYQISNLFFHGSEGCANTHSQWLFHFVLHKLKKVCFPANIKFSFCNIFDIEVFFILALKLTTSLGVVFQVIKYFK